MSDVTNCKVSIDAEHFSLENKTQRLFSRNGIDTLQSSAIKRQTQTPLLLLAGFCGGTYVGNKAYIYQ